MGIGGLNHTRPRLSFAGCETLPLIKNKKSCGLRDCCLRALCRLRTCIIVSR